MVNLMRKYQQTLMLLVTIVVIISFVVLYNVQQLGDPTQDRVGKLYGKSISVTDLQREARKFDVCQALGLFEFARAMLDSGVRDRSSAATSFAWNSLILRHEAAALGIQPTDAEKRDVILKLPAFQTNNSFDITKFNEFVSHIASRGFTDQQIGEIVDDSLRYQKLKAILGATVPPSSSEVRSIYEISHQMTETSVVRFKTEDFAATLKVPDEDVAKLYEERKASLNSEEMRKVKYVLFGLPKSEKPLEAKDRVAEMTKLADQAQAFALKMTEKDAKFEDVAKTFAVEVKETEEFAMNNLPEPLRESRDAGQVVFQKLTLEQPNSDVMLSQNGYFVTQLTGITPPKPLTLEQAKGTLADEIKQERAMESLNLKAAELRQKIQVELTAGKTFADAASAAGVKAESIPPFSLNTPPKDQSFETQTIVDSAFDLNVHQLSSPISTPTGALLLYLEKRLPIDEKKFEEDKGKMTDNIAQGKREAAFGLWMKSRRTLAKATEGRS